MTRHTIYFKLRVGCGLQSRRSFTLTELLVAMGIIAIIGGITAIGLRTVSQDAKKASATNIVVATLEHARALAIRENTLAAVVFRARLDEGNRQYIEIVTAKWTRESPVIWTTGATSPRVVDRFVPAPGVSARRLPVGMSVAAPLYHSTAGENWDETWGFLSYLPTTAAGNEPVREAPGRVFGVIYGPDGRVVTRNSSSDADRFYVDFDNDGLQRLTSCGSCQDGYLDYANPPNSVSDEIFRIQWMFQKDASDEPYVTVAPFLAVYDEKEFREAYDPEGWSPDDWQTKHDQLTEFVNEHADRLHFNRFTGVILR